MAQSFEKVKIASDDLNLDTPGSGASAAGTFTRKLSDGTTGNNPNTGLPWNKFGADAVPHRDEAVVSGGGQPFARVSAASRNSEMLMRDIRINTPDMVNFEGYGGIAGSGISDTNAAKNTQIFDKILADIASGAVNGIYFPGRRYEFMEWAGSVQHTPNTGLYAAHILPMAGISGLKLKGAGEGATTLAANSNANTAFHLFYVPDVSDIVFEDMKMDLTSSSTNGSCVYVAGLAAIPSRFAFRRVNVQNGSVGSIRLIGSTNFPIQTYWIEDCTFADTKVGSGLFCQAVTGGTIENNFFSGAVNDGIIMTTTGGANAPLNTMIIRGNRFQGTLQDIYITRSGAYDGTVHKDFKIVDNQISNGDVRLSGINEWQVNGNQFYNGGIRADFQGMTGAHNLHMLENLIEGGNAFGSGIRLLGNGVTISGYQIRGGRIHNVDQYGVDLLCENGAFRRGHISDLYVLNCSREDTGTTDYSAIRLHETASTGSHYGTTICNNILWQTAATSTNGNKQTYGIEMTNNGGATDRCLVHDNQVAGWTTAAYLLRGTNTIADSHDNIDHGTAPLA